MKKFICIFLVLCILLLSGCVGDIDKANDKTIVAASFYPVYIFTLNLLNGIDGISVECMAEQTAGCLHDYTLTAKDAKLLNDAQVLVINGGGMESFLSDAFESVDSLNVIDSSENAHILCDKEHHHEENEHSHNHESNSHIWLSVENAKIQVDNICKGLIEEFPAYKSAIEKNCADYMERLNMLEAEGDKLAEYLKEFSVISFHGAYEYIGKDAGIEIITTVESDEGYEPSAKELAHLSGEIKEKNIRALFVAPDYSGSAAEILQRETGAEVCVINPFISGEVKLTAYEDAMTENYKTILKVVN